MPPKASKTAARQKTSEVRTTSEIRQERSQQQRRQRLVWGGIALLVTGALIFLAVLTSRLPAEAPIPDSISRYEGLTVSRTERGYARLGALDGTVRVSAFISLASSSSKTFHETIFPQLLERVKAGEISLTYVLYDANQRAEVSNTAGATRAAWCAGEQNKLFHYVDAAFSWMTLYGPQAYASNRLFSGADNLGLDRPRFDECMRSDRPQELANRAAQDAGGRDAVVIAPAIFVNDVIVTGEDLLTAANEAINRALEFRAGSPTTDAPTAVPTESVTTEPTGEPTTSPTDAPTIDPTEEPTTAPTEPATEQPTANPTRTPRATAQPTTAP
jgi:hypothetical protein